MHDREYYHLSQKIFLKMSAADISSPLVTSREIFNSKRLEQLHKRGGELGKNTLGAVIFSLGDHLLPPTLAPHWKQLTKKKLALRNKRYVDTGQ